MTEAQNRQLPHLVFGGELKAVDSTEFPGPAAAHAVGIDRACKSACDAWRAACEATADNASMR